MKGLKTINRFLYFFNLELIQPRYKEALMFAKDYFKDKPISCCEIGVYRGHHAQMMKKFLNIKEFYLVDSYKDSDDYEKVENSSPYLWKKEAHKRIKPHRKYYWIEEDSHRASALFELTKVTFDFCYIDGNHAYSYVIKDLEDYWNLINKGGILAGHDINQSDVSKAVLEFAFKNKLRVYFGDRRDWWIIK